MVRAPAHPFFGLRADERRMNRRFGLRSAGIA
jgi:hypothetical protein